MRTCRRCRPEHAHLAQLAPQLDPLLAFSRIQRALRCIILDIGAAIEVPVGLNRTHLSPVVACRPNTFAIALALRPACTGSTTCGQNARVYLVRCLLIQNAFGVNHKVSIKRGNFSPTAQTSTIEQSFSKLKTLLRKAQVRMLMPLWRAVTNLLNLLNPSQREHCIGHCGYRPSG